ncbi:MAG TPA: hypothetical protein GYA10_14245, partial [Alphaproteobacteria bacterium]|nr:hypothetical protein [Alphaproteobacteria bacterium]
MTLQSPKAEAATPVRLPRRKMKITKVEPISLYVPIEEKIDAPIAVPHASDLTDVIFSGYRTTLVRIETDCGLTGVGECMVRLAPTATRAIISDVAKLLIGRDQQGAFMFGFDFDLQQKLMYASYNGVE